MVRGEDQHLEQFLDSGVIKILKPALGMQAVLERSIVEIMQGLCKHLPGVLLSQEYAVTNTYE